MASSSVSRGAADDRVQFETLISDTSAFLMASEPGQVKAAIETALERVRTFFEADRCGLLTVSPDQQEAHVECGLYGDGVAHVSPEVNLIDVYPWARSKLLVDRAPVIFHRLDELPPEAAIDRGVFEQLGIRSHLAVPVSIGRSVTHVILVHWVHKEWRFPDAYVSRLRVLGEVIVAALERRRAFEALKRSFDALQASEERLERSAAAGGCGLWELDIPAGRIWVTSETRRLYGLTAEEQVTWERFVGLLHPDDRDRVVASVAASVDGDLVFDERYRIVRDDGSERWMHVTSRKGSPTRLLGASVDETGRVEAERRTAREVARVAAAVELAEIGFSEWTVGGGPPFVDTRMRDLLGLENETTEVFQEQWLSRIHPDDREEVDERRRRLLAGEIDDVACEYRYEQPGRGWIWVRHISRREIAPGSQGAVHVVGAVQDITERRNREEELRKLRDQLHTENLYLRQETARHFGAKRIGGRGPAIRSALALAEQVAPTNATVLLTGETGTGKERFATLIHEASPRRARPMVRVNCSAIPAALVESELFGRERGAFTGAVAKQVGRFEVAHGSTIFLDEIGDLPLEVQSKLLRVLQERQIERLGNPRPVEVDVRVVAATNHDLVQRVREGMFRSDLFYRLNVFPIVVPSLRDRREDIPVLVVDLVEDIGAVMGKRFDAVAKTSMEALQRYDWPGNVRELRNVLERAMILSPGPTIWIDPLVIPAPAPETDVTSTAVPLDRLLDVERAHILRVLDEVGWRIKGPDSASVRLGMNPSTLYLRMKKLRITRPEK